MTFDILPVKKPKNSDPILDKIPNPLVKPSFLGVVVAGVNSGKSNLLINLIYRSYTKEVFKGGIIIFSPNIYNDDIFDLNLVIDDEIIKFDTDLDNIDMYVKAIVEKQQEKDKDDRERILLIFDDCLGYIKQGGYISNFCTRYRQLNFSLIFTTQIFRAIPHFIRGNATFMIFFISYNQKELDKIEEEMSHIPNFRAMYDYAVNEQYSFLYVILKGLKVYKKFDDNFLLWSKNDKGKGLFDQHQTNE